MENNLKISQFVAADSFLNNDEIPFVRLASGSYSNYKMSGLTLSSAMATKFITIDLGESLQDQINELDEKVDSNYNELSAQITNTGQSIVTALSNMIVSYYDVLSNTIVSVDNKYAQAIANLSNTMQDWLDVIDNKANVSDLIGFANRLTSAENLLTQLAEIVYDYQGGGSGGGGTPGYHTQSTATIYPLTGYYRTGSMEALSTTDTLNQALGKLESRVLNVESNGGGGSGVYLIKTNDVTQPADINAYSALRSREEFLSKKDDDTASGYIKFLKGWQAGNSFTPGFMGVGASLYPVASKWNLEVDNLFVRGSAQFNELVVNEIKAIGGDLLITAADMTITSVEELSAQDVYRCYFDNQDGEVLNKFVAYDQAICQQFDGAGAKRYWRLVTAVGENYVDLSISDAEAGSAIPQEGDVLIQLGNRTNAARRSAIWISSMSTAGPAITMYDNITTFDLTNKDRTTIGANSSKFVGTLMQTTVTGDIIQVPRDMGQYVAGQTYYYYDRVSYDGSLWLCIANVTTTAPDAERPDIWQVQVAKGDKGTTGSDVGQWVEIMGQTLFLYEQPNYGGTPTPAVLDLIASVHNIDNPVYEWKVLETSDIISTQMNCLAAPQLFGQHKTITLQCTVTSGSDIFTDRVQLAKLTNGEAGENAYYVWLSNENMSIPYTNDGQNPLIPLSDVWTSVAVYFGTAQQDIVNITYETIEGNATCVIDNGLVKLNTLGSTNARVRISTELTNGSTFYKDWWLTKIFNGPSGQDGADAAYVIVTGEQTFKVQPDNTITPDSITLTAVPYNIPNPTYQWSWRNVGTDEWTYISGATSETYIVLPNGTGFTSGELEVVFKCEVTAQFGATTYSDIITVNKLRDGRDGETIYYGILSNENQTVTSNHAGVVEVETLAKVTSSYKMFFGTTEMEYSQDYTIRIIQPDPTNTSALFNDTETKTLKLSSLSTTHDVTVFKIEFIKVSGNQVVDVVDFTISKSKNGAPGDYEVIIYAYKTSQPSRPTFQSIPSSVGTAGPDGTLWYTTIPSGGHIYMTSAMFSGETGFAKLNTEGQYWSQPTKISGVEGPQGPQGNQGSDGAKGDPGPTGPGLVYRGAWQSSTNYYLNQYQADVVYYGSTYYVRIGSYTSTQSAPTNTEYWKYLNTFENIATGMLFTKKALISGWNFNDNYIWAPNGYVYFNGAATNTPSIGIGANAMPSSLVPNASCAVKIYPQGAIILGDGTTTGNVGLSGEGSSSSDIRIWAGSTHANRGTAPFMVTQGGTLTAKNAVITGTTQTGASGSRTIISNNGWSGGPGIDFYYSTGQTGAIYTLAGGLGMGLSSWTYQGIECLNLNYNGLWTKNPNNQVETYFQRNRIKIDLSVFPRTSNDAISVGGFYIDSSGIVKCKLS